MSVKRLPDAEQALRWLAGRLGAAGASVPAASATGRLVTDSRKLQPGDAFIAWPGAATDGRQYVAAALAAGAAACLVEAEGVEAFGFEDARVAALAGLKAASGPLAAAWYGHPGARMRVVAVTGTNGKSSTAWWTAQALSALGQASVVAGTLGIGRPPRGVQPALLKATGLTTPDPVTLHATLAQEVAWGVEGLAIEASSIGLVEHRMDGLPVTVAQFTNFTRDHLDYHGDMGAYWAAKRVLFDWPGLQAAVVNVDDPQGAALAAELTARRDLALWTTGRRQPARLVAQALRYEDGGLAFDLVEDGQRAPVRSRLIGDYNADNLLAVLGALRALGVSLAQAAAVVPALSPVPGRMQQVVALPARAGDAAALPTVVVDYAHTPDALDKALGALRPLAAARGGRLLCVFGCGGNRDATKRPLMGAVAQRGADAVWLTSDNPRHEEPQAILAQIAAGFRADGLVPEVIADRRAAIAQVVAGADARDVVLVAGKGHETTQEVAGRKLPFDDAQEAAAALAQRRAAAAPAAPTAPATPVTSVPPATPAEPRPDARRDPGHDPDRDPGQPGDLPPGARA